ncbi:hypothetical protein ACP70R_037521 [Stipagrostis hirtigluma subsp. patula]
MAASDCRSAFDRFVTTYVYTNSVPPSALLHSVFPSIDLASFTCRPACTSDRAESAVHQQ